MTIAGDDNFGINLWLHGKSERSENLANADSTLSPWPGRLPKKIGEAEKKDHQQKFLFSAALKVEPLYRAQRTNNYHCDNILVYFDMQEIW